MLIMALKDASAQLAPAATGADDADFFHFLAQIPAPDTTCTADPLSLWRSSPERFPGAVPAACKRESGNLEATDTQSAYPLPAITGTSQSHAGSISNANSGKLFDYEHLLQQFPAGAVDSSQGPQLSASQYRERNREKNRAAQRRFRLKQKTKMATTEEAVDALTAQMQSWQSKANALEARNRVLQHIVDSSSTHLSELVTEQEVDVRQQEIILRDSLAVYGKGLGEDTCTIADMGSWSMGMHMTTAFSKYLDRLRQLLKEGTAASDLELTTLVQLRRKEENRLGLFSHWSGAVKAWNLEAGRGFGNAPTPAFWTEIMARAGLSRGQLLKLAEARTSLLQRMAAIRQQRQSTFTAVSLALLHPEPQNLAANTAVQDMRTSLEEERLATLDFLHTTIDQVLSPKQESLLDTCSYPWWPDLWIMSGIAAGSQQPAASAEGMDLPVALPQLSSFEVLTTPMLAIGGGLQMKRSIALRELPGHILTAAACMPPNIATLQDMSILDVMCGKYLPSRTVTKTS